MYNVLIQPFHCIIYMVFSTVIITLLEGTPIKLGNGLLVIIIMIFMRQAETIIRNIFGFGNAKSLGDAVAAGALVASSINAAGKTLGAIKGAKDASKGGSKGGDKKPALKDTSNVGNTQRSTTVPTNAELKTGQTNTGNTNSSNNSGSSSGGNNSSASTNNSGSPSGGNNSSASTNNSGSSSGGNNSSTSTNNGASSYSNNSTTATQSGGNFSAGGLGDTVERQERKFNTEAVDKAQSKFEKVMGYCIGANVKAIELATGIGLGGAMGGDVPSMIAGANFAKVGVNAAKVGGQKVINGFKNSAGQRNKRITQKTNDVIDAYNDLKSDKNWSNDRMIDETERVLKMKDTSKIKDEKLRKYAETVQDLRTEYEDKYQAPNDMVLDRVSKIQQGTVRKDLSRKYTKGSKTRPIERYQRRNRRNNQNGQNGQ